MPAIEDRYCGTILIKNNYTRRCSTAIADGIKKVFIYLIIFKEKCSFGNRIPHPLILLICHFPLPFLPIKTKFTNWLYFRIRYKDADNGELWTLIRPNVRINDVRTASLQISKQRKCRIQFNVDDILNVNPVDREDKST